MKNHDNAPKKGHHEKTCCAHTRASDSVAATTSENTSDNGAKNKDVKKH